MGIKSQNVLDYHGNNTVFMVWNFKKNLDVQSTFIKICKIIININNLVETRFPDFEASCVIGTSYISHHN